MARRDYNRMYKPSYEEKEEPIVEVVEKVEEVKKPKSYIGIVIGGLNLNIRSTPNGKIVSSLKDGDRIAIIDDSDPDWYKIADGYVMKKFVKIQEG